MKITCQTCQAKYTIADDKVAGKVVKIKCKKCSATIVVSGNEAALADPPPQAPGMVVDDDEGETKIFMESPVHSSNTGAGAEEWTVNITDDDQRTMTTQQLLNEIKSGVVTKDTFVWKDGMADWLAVSDVPELASRLPAPNRGLPGKPAGADAPGVSPLAAAPTGGVSAARRAGAKGGGVDLFGAAAAEPAPVAPAAAAEKHVGERNENSVLFSLSALTATENAAKASSKSDQAVIDLGPSKPRNGGRAGLDDIMNLGGGIGGGMAASPALAPPPLLAPVVEAPAPPPVAAASPAASIAAPLSIPAPKKKGNTGLIIGIAAVVVLAAGAAFVFMQKSPAPAPVASASPDAPAPTQGAAPTPSATPSAVADAPPTPTAAPDPSGTPSATAANDKPDKPGTQGGATPPSGPKPGGGPIAAVTPKPDKPDKPDKPAPPPAAPDPPPPAPAPASGGAEFNRGAASAALGAAAGGAKGCKKADGPTGSGRVKVTFAPSGNVTTATVDGPPFAGTPTGGCVASLFRGAHVPPFDGSPVTVTKSFNIN
jgi:predicted Zn finger-like uncharacterized protein